MSLFSALFWGLAVVIFLMIFFEEDLLELESKYDERRENKKHKNAERSGK